ncbi:SIR2 family protein [Bradyrhizobium japonicum]|uniref:SIR2 family protein n=1 Tax=Bradyrhizobium japonicum TaxID=375 RepID=UPI0003FB8D27|nr:SIR2 family protein [Bradyrhizobium japonicum]
MDQAPFRPFFTNAILEGSAILFVGAGLSFLCKNKNGATLPNGEVLKQQLHAETGTRKIFPLEKISSFYVKKFGSARLYEYLVNALTVHSMSKELIDFYKLPWRRIYTTNYDNAIEFARHSSRGRASYNLQDPTIEIPDGAIVHINGSIETVAPQTIAENLRLTDYSYANSNFESQKEWCQFFLNDLRVTRMVIFVGYSLADLDIARLLLTTALQAKTIFFIAPDADEVEVATLEPFGAVNTDGIESLFNLITEAKKTFQKSELSPTFYSIAPVSELKGANADRPVTAKIFEQFVYGALAFPEIVSGALVVGKTPFNVTRTLVESCARAVVRGDARDFAIVGDLASGKTFAAFDVARILISAGYQVYWVQDGRKLESDLDRLSTINEKVCLIVDGYGKYIDTVRNYIRRRPAHHVLVVTERSATHEVVWPLLREHLLSSHVPEIVLDQLADREIADFEELTNFTGLWTKELAGRTPGHRRGYISGALNRSLYRLLLEILKSEKVKTEIASILAPISENVDARRFFTTALIVSFLGYNFWINDWQSFYRIRNVRDLLRKYSDQIRHFVVVDASSIRPRTNVTSLFMLQNYVDDETICECLADIYEAAVANQNSDSEFRDAYFNLTRYNVIEPLFSERNKLKMLVKYYETIRPIGDTRNNPDYWLQLGIASTIASQFSDAETAFKNAYARENSKNRPNTVRIDNYYARFQLEHAAWIDRPDQAFRLFKSGFNLLLKQIFKDDNRHYPFKAGRALAGLAAKHFDHWSAIEQQSFAGGCATLLKKAQEWTAKNKSHEDVSAMIREINVIQKRIGK